MQNQVGGINLQMAIGHKNNTWHVDDLERKNYRKLRLK